MNPVIISIIFKLLRSVSSIEPVKIRKSGYQTILGFTILIGIFIGSNPAYGQSTHLMAENLGLGGGGAAYMDGYHANFINPANISIHNGQYPNITVGIMGAGVNFGGPLANVSVYNQYLTRGRVINDVADKMYDSWFGPRMSSNKRAGAVMNAVPLGAVYRMDDWAFSLAYRARSLTDVTVNRGTMEFFTFLLDESKFNDPQPVNFELNVMNVSEFSAGISRKVWEGSLHTLIPAFMDLPLQLHAGIAPKILVGHSSMSIDFNSEIYFQDGTRIHDFQYTIRSVGEITKQLQSYYQDRQVENRNVSFPDYIKPSEEKFAIYRAVGIGLDIGFTAQLDLNTVEQLDWGKIFEGNKYARIGLSLTDIGSINMSNGTGRFTADGQLRWNGFEAMFDEERLNSEFDSSRTQYVDHVTDSIANNIYLGYRPQATPEISNQLPTMLHLGTRFQVGKAGVVFDLARGLTNRGMTSTATMAAFGLEYTLFEIWPLRIGMRTGGLGSTSYSFGTGLNFNKFEFNISAMSIRSSKSNGYYLAGAFGGLVFHF